LTFLRSPDSGTCSSLQFLLTNPRTKAPFMSQRVVFFCFSLQRSYFLRSTQTSLYILYCFACIFWCLVLSSIVSEYLSHISILFNKDPGSQLTQTTLSNLLCGYSFLSTLFIQQLIFGVVQTILFSITIGPVFSNFSTVILYSVKVLFIFKNKAKR
jgi:hypothetical protein